MPTNPKTNSRDTKKMQEWGLLRNLVTGQMDLYHYDCGHRIPIAADELGQTSAFVKVHRCRRKSAP